MMAEKLQAFPCPCYSLPGNHDMKMMGSRREAEALLGLDSASFSLDRDGLHLVFLSTGLWPERGPERGGILRTHGMTEEDLAWPQADLAKNTLPVLVFTHYPLAEDASVTDPCMFMENRAALKEILASDPHVRAVFSGHQHRTKTIVERGIPYFVLGSMTASPAENGIPDGVYLCVEADADTVRVTTHAVQI